MAKKKNQFPNFKKAIIRPFTNLKILIYVILLSIIPIVNFISIGYLIKCAKTASKKKYELPKLEKYGDLWGNGIVASILAGIFVLVLMAFVLIILMPFSNYLEEVSIFKFFSTSLLWGKFDYSLKFSLAIYIIPSLIATYFATSALINYSLKETYEAFFDFKTIFKKALTLRYLIPWIIITIYTLLISYVLQFIPYIGKAITLAIGGIAFFSVMGETYNKIK